MSATNLTTPCRVSIYWDRMDAWFAATVRSQDAATGRYEVLYDDDNETEFMFLAPVDAEGVARARGAPCRLMDATPPVEDVARDVAEGTRVEVYWDREDRWYAGTVADRCEETAGTFLVEYDDGDSEMITFAARDAHGRVRRGPPYRVIDDASTPRPSRPPSRRVPRPWIAAARLPSQ
ncbi:hypothetical protein SO694_0013809 [Aureococcus anophagefferens]|uniref:BAHCC1-like Tudor domain-containing protein n=1 Tax=Aureococcus anophagefferens TaxID=44056 RepID=A0ABR1GFT8_AURAN|nr:hypothetical protein JL721_5481 [Aureococcus anophagefferens]